jgi:hypothetical protein
LSLLAFEGEELLDLLCGLEAVHDRHVTVHKDDFVILVPKGIPAVARLGQD